MTEQVHQLNSPSQLRAADAMVNWVTSPSPFGYDGLLSMEITSPFLQFSPITFGAHDGEQSDLVTVFSPSMFSPSKSKFNVTSRLLKKRELCTSNPFQINDVPDLDLYRGPTLQFDDVQSLSQVSKVENYPQFTASNSSFLRSPFASSSSNIRDSEVSNVPIVGSRAKPLRSSAVEKPRAVSIDVPPRSVFFSPETTTKPSNHVSHSYSLGIADVKAARSSSSVKEAKASQKKSKDTDEGIPPLKRKLGRSGSIDQNIFPCVSKDFKDEGCESQASSGSSSVSKAPSSNAKNILSSGANMMSISAYTSPSVSNMRDELQKGYTDANMVTPSQCKCKKTKCLKLYCDCFALLRFCGSNCGCNDCHNDPTHEEIRKAAIITTMQRTATAFTSKVTPTSAHVAGCNCSKSNCLKKYCECFLGGATCGVSCKCQSCKNYPGSESLNALRKPDGTLQTVSTTKQIKEKRNKMEDEPYVLSTDRGDRDGEILQLNYIEDNHENNSGFHSQSSSPSDEFISRIIDKGDESENILYILKDSKDESMDRILGKYMFSEERTESVSHFKNMTNKSNLNMNYNDVINKEEREMRDIREGREGRETRETRAGRDVDRKRKSGEGDRMSSLRARLVKIGADPIQYQYPSQLETVQQLHQQQLQHGQHTHGQRTQHTQAVQQLQPVSEFFSSLNTTHTTNNAHTTHNNTSVSPETTLPLLLLEAQPPQSLQSLKGKKTKKEENTRNLDLESEFIGNISESKAQLWGPDSTGFGSKNNTEGVSRTVHRTVSDDRSHSSYLHSGSDSVASETSNAKKTKIFENPRQNEPSKIRKLNETKIVYPYFGQTLPPAPKICALRCLEFLEGKDFYNMSIVSHLWSKTSTDKALWE